MRAPVTIEIRQAGGFAGIERTLALIDSDELSRAGAAELKESLSWLEQRQATQAESVGADRFQYQLRVVEPGTAPRTLTVFDEGDPEDPALKRVLAILDLVGVRP